MRQIYKWQYFKLQIQNQQMNVIMCFLSCYRLLLFVDEADAFLRKRSTVSLHVSFPRNLLNTFFHAVSLSSRYINQNICHVFFFVGEDQWRPQSYFECILVSHWRTEQQVNIHLCSVQNVNHNRVVVLNCILLYLFQLGDFPACL